MVFEPVAVANRYGFTETLDKQLIRQKTVRSIRAVICLLTSDNKREKPIATLNAFSAT